MEYDENVTAMIGAGPLRRPDFSTPSRDADARRRRDEDHLLDAAHDSLPTSMGQEHHWVAMNLDLSGFSWWRRVEPLFVELNRARRVMILHPKTGTGKTALAIWLMLQMLGEARSDAATEAQIARASQARFIPERQVCPPSEVVGRSRLDEALRARYLVLDDMGSTGCTTYFFERVRYLLREQRADGGTLIMTTYLEPREWWERYGGDNERRFYMHDPERGQYVLDLRKYENAR